MTRRTGILLIALVWACAAGLWVLPLAWPAYAHVVGNRLAQQYELEASGVVAGWTTRDILCRRRRRVS